MSLIQIRPLRVEAMAGKSERGEGGGEARTQAAQGALRQVCVSAITYLLFILLFLFSPSIQ